MSLTDHSCPHCGNASTVPHHMTGDDVYYCCNCYRDFIIAPKVEDKVRCPLCGNSEPVEDHPSGRAKLYLCTWCDEDFELTPSVLPDCPVCGKHDKVDRALVWKNNPQKYKNLYFCQRCDEGEFYWIPKMDVKKECLWCHTMCDPVKSPNIDNSKKLFYHCPDCKIDFLPLERLKKPTPSEAWLKGKHVPVFIVKKGLPASGKTLSANLMMNKNPTKYIRVNKDEIREELAKTGWTWSHENEKKVLVIRDRMIVDGLKAGKDVISDDTNLSPAHIKRFEEIAKECGASIRIDFLNTPLSECIARDSRRLGTAKVGEKVIRDMAEKYGLVERPATPIKSVLHVPPEGDPFFKIVENDERLMSAIICDIDGTLAHIGKRDPYDCTNCGADGLNTPIAKIIRNFSTYSQVQIIYVSGREDKWKSLTTEWMIKHRLPTGPMYMRPTRDFRKDWVIKGEIFNANIRDKYNVLFVLDDRNQVVDFWRKLGLTCLQVAPGAF